MEADARVDTNHWQREWDTESYSFKTTDLKVNLLAKNMAWVHDCAMGGSA